MDLNEQILIGTVGQEPTTRGTSENAAVVFTVATNHKQGGEQKTIWNNIVTFGKTAQICKQYVKKGSKLFIRGRVNEYKYRVDGEDRDRIKHEIIVEKVCFVGGQPKNEESSQDQSSLFNKKTPF